MSAPAVTAAPKAVAPKKAKVSKPKAAATHPTYAAMVKSAVATLAEKKGSSRAAILKYICQHYKVGDNLVQINARLRAALKRGAASGLLKQTKGTGASGSFRLGEKKKVEKKKTVKKVAKKPVAKKAGPASPKKKVAKKPKAAKPKSPKKAKAPKKAGAAKPKSPKKVKKTVKKAATKKAAKPAKAAPAQ